MKKITIIKHLNGAPGMRILGLGPNLIPCRALHKLKEFLHKNTFWAKNREVNELKTCLANSDAIVSIWFKKELVGFGRGVSDGIYRGVLWDIVIDQNHQGKGYGKIIVKLLLNSKKLKNADKIYLMTTNQTDFYVQLGFDKVNNQDLLIRKI